MRSIENWCPRSASRPSTVTPLTESPEFMPMYAPRAGIGTVLLLTGRGAAVVGAVVGVRTWVVVVGLALLVVLVVLAVVVGFKLVLPEEEFVLDVVVLLVAGAVVVVVRITTETGSFG